MYRAGRWLRHYVSIEQVTNLVRAKAAASPAVARTLLIDVRSTAEVARTGLIPTAVNIPLPILQDALDPDGAIDDDAFEAAFGVARPEPARSDLIFYCAHGIRSATAADVAERLGYARTYNFAGSWAQWYHTYGGDEADDPTKDTPQP
ncbi:endoplasmic reticulum protein [Strigomonas culicis]|uniref:Endoplasmic reticulum protein n=1 Tax=Strigomonas culicis TaxID=28005 RepID=S9TFQ2_9TRYP|nr:endoplasmic reticulum protein [Strigomonas culicis]|eukprot:EPY15143.1 endoplasmic reticulum protein [Strigomonas culicis]